MNIGECTNVNDDWLMRQSVKRVGKARSSSPPVAPASAPAPSPSIHHKRKSPVRSSNKEPKCFDKHGRGAADPTRTAAAAAATKTHTHTQHTATKKAKATPLKATTPSNADAGRGDWFFDDSDMSLFG
jgi:hypothetical protein